MFDFLLDKYKLHKVLTVSACVTRFINYCWKIKKRGHPTKSEIQCQENFYIKRQQRKMEPSEKFEESRKQLNLQLNGEGIYECKGSTYDVYPIYLPSRSALSKKIIMSSHRKNLHAGEAPTMSELRSWF